MLKKTIKFTDLDGIQVEEDAYFNLTKAEAIELNIRNDLEVIGRNRDNDEVMDTFKRILSSAYGKRTSDGKFLKEPRDWQIFVAGEAYSELFMEIWQNPDYAIEFIKGMLPAGIVDPEGQTNQSDIPAHMANHPSMQGYQAKKSPESPRREARSTDWDRNNEETRTPEQRAAVDPEYAEFLAFKAAQERDNSAQINTGNEAHPEAAWSVTQTPPDRVSSPEATQIDSQPPRGDLI